MMLSGGPLADAMVWLDAHGGFDTLTIAAMKGFPSGRYINTIWTPDEALQDHSKQFAEFASSATDAPPK